MYGFDQLEQCDVFLGKELIQFCVGENEIILRFYSDLEITVLFKIQIDGREFSPITIDGDGFQRLKSFLRYKISDASISRDALSLRFANGKTIVLWDEKHRQHESVVISAGKETFVV